MLFLQHFTAYTDTNFRHLKINSFQNSVPRPVSLILSTDESMLQYIKEKYVKNSKKCYFYSIFTAFYSINSKFYREIFENLVWSDKLSIPDAHPNGCFYLLFFFERLKPPTMRDYQKTWGSYKKCVHT